MKTRKYGLTEKEKGNRNGSHIHYMQTCIYTTQRDETFACEKSVVAQYCIINIL